MPATHHFERVVVDHIAQPRLEAELAQCLNVLGDA